MLWIIGLLHLEIYYAVKNAVLTTVNHDYERDDELKQSSV